MTKTISPKTADTMYRIVFDEYLSVLSDRGLDTACATSFTPAVNVPATKEKLVELLSEIYADHHDLFSLVLCRCDMTPFILVRVVGMRVRTEIDPKLAAIYARFTRRMGSYERQTGKIPGFPPPLMEADRLHQANSIKTDLATRLALLYYASGEKFPPFVAECGATPQFMYDTLGLEGLVSEGVVLNRLFRKAYSAFIKIMVEKNVEPGTLEDFAMDYAPEYLANADPVRSLRDLLRTVKQYNLCDFSNFLWDCGISRTIVSDTLGCRELLT